MRGKLLDILLKSGYPGSVYPVNPSASVIQGLKAYPDLASIPEVPDLILVAVPGAGVPEIIAEAKRIGVKSAVIMSSGVDPARVKAAAGGSGMLIFGTNTEGFYHAGHRFAATFAQVVDTYLSEGRQTAAQRPGRPISVVSQSGGMGFATFGRLVEDELDVHAVITTGNEDFLDCLDVIDYLVDEGETGAIVLFVEGFKNGRRFGAVADRAAAAGIPIIAIKVGASDAGQRAAISHTAHLAGSDAAYDAIFRHHGVIRVRDLEALLAVAAAVSRLPVPAGRRVAVLTTSGGAGTWAADSCAACGLDVPELSSKLQNEIAKLLPSYATTGNPVDVTGQAVEDGGGTLVAVLRCLISSPEIDSILVNMGLAKPDRVAKLAAVLAPLLAESQKPILFHSHISPRQENFAALAAMGGVGVKSLRAAGLAFDALARRREALSIKPGKLPSVSPNFYFAGAESGVLAEKATRSLLEGYGIPAPPTSLVTTEEEAAAVAQTMGFPVVLKIQSVDIQHKTEVGGVALNIVEDTIRNRFQSILASARQHVPDARIEGVLVQKMMPPGYEMIVGIVDDPDFGPFVVLGAGGIYAELLRDTAMSPAPIDREEALRMIASLRMSAILEGARGKPRADVEALADLLVNVGLLAHTERTHLRQLDLNPVLVYPEGQGAVAVDALAVSGPSALGSLAACL
jgi:acetyltransferase